MGLKEKLDGIASARSDARTLMENAAIYVQSTTQWGTMVTVPIKRIRARIASLQQELSIYKQLTSGTITNTSLKALKSAGLIGDIGDLGVGVVTLPSDIAASLLSDVKSVRKTIEEIYASIVASLAIDYMETRYNKVIEVLLNEIETCLYNAENALNALIAAFKLSPITPDIYVIPDGNTSNVRIVQAYGYTYVAATVGLKLDALAATYLGNPDDGLLIALANGISEEMEVEPGALLRIPSSVQSNVYNNEVYSRTDNFGVDIALSESGQIMIDASGELVTIKAEENISQALKLRLSESIGNRIRLTVYGIRSNIGQPISAASAYVATSIKDTIIHDPRITRVENFVFRGVGDRIYVQFDYVVVDGRRGTYQGVA